MLKHVAQIDHRLQRILFTTNIQTRNELEKQLRAFVFGKRNDQKSPDCASASEHKMQKLSSRMNLAISSQSAEPEWLKKEETLHTATLHQVGTCQP